MAEPPSAVEDAKKKRMTFQPSDDVLILRAASNSSLFGSLASAAYGKVTPIWAALGQQWWNDLPGSDPRKRVWGKDCPSPGDSFRRRVMDLMAKHEKRVSSDHAAEVDQGNKGEDAKHLDADHDELYNLASGLLRSYKDYNDVLKSRAETVEQKKEKQVQLSNAGAKIRATAAASASSRLETGRQKRKAASAGSADEGGTAAMLAEAADIVGLDPAAATTAISLVNAEDLDDDDDDEEEPPRTPAGKSRSTSSGTPAAGRRFRGLSAEFWNAKRAAAPPLPVAPPPVAPPPVAPPPERTALTQEERKETAERFRQAGVPGAVLAPAMQLMKVVDHQNLEFMQGDEVKFYARFLIQRELPNFQFPPEP